MMDLETVYAEVQLVLRKVEVIEHLAEGVKDHEARIRHLEKNEEIVTRIRDLERWKYAQPATVITAAVTGGLALIALFIGVLN